MNIIVNVDENWAIGYRGKLLFPISADLKRFAQLTTGKVVVMGRSTLESLPGGKPLKNRENVVLSRSRFAPDSAVKKECDSSPHAALKTEIHENLSFCASAQELDKLLASARFARFAPEDIFVIGGQSVYELLLDKCTTAYITKVEAAASQSDSFFPNLDTIPGWKITETSGPFFQNSIAYRYITYQKTGIL